MKKPQHSCLHFLPFCAIWVLSLPAWAAAADPSAAAPAGNQCHVKQSFPDGTTWEGDCEFRITLAGAPLPGSKGMVTVKTPHGSSDLVSIAFVPPRDIQADHPYTLTVDRDAAFLNGMVVLSSGKEYCQMNRRKPAQGTLTFRTLGATSSAFHGTMEFAPTCDIHRATPQQREVPGNDAGGGRTTVTF